MLKDPIVQIAIDSDSLDRAPSSVAIGAYSSLLASNIRTLIEESGLSINLLSKKAGLSDAVLRGYDRNYYGLPSGRSLVLIALALDVPVARLFQADQHNEEYTHHENPNDLSKPLLLLDGKEFSHEFKNNYGEEDHNILYNFIVKYPLLVIPGRILQANGNYKVDNVYCSLWADGSSRLVVVATSVTEE